MERLDSRFRGNDIFMYWGTGFLLPDQVRDKFRRNGTKGDPLGRPHVAHKQF